jgi:hypothetical protein
VYLERGVEYQITKVREDEYIELRVPNVSYETNLTIKKADFEEQFYENIFNQGLITERQAQEAALQSAQTAQTPRAEEAQSENAAAIDGRVAGADAQSEAREVSSAEVSSMAHTREEKLHLENYKNFRFPKAAQLLDIRKRDLSLLDDSDEKTYPIVVEGMINSVLQLLYPDIANDEYHYIRDYAMTSSRIQEFVSDDENAQRRGYFPDGSAKILRPLRQVPVYGRNHGEQRDYLRHRHARKQQHD